MLIKKLFLPLALFLLLLPCACTENESSLGLELQDPFTFYHGTRDTAYLTACTIFDDSLSTSGYTAAVLGDYQDPIFGSMKAIVYSQFGAPTSGVNITDDVIFDSVVMTLVIDTVYPILPDSTPRTMHIIVRQLAEALVSDSLYLSTNSLPQSDVVLFDDEVTYYADSIRVRFNENIYPILRQTCTQAQFLNISKGLAIQLADHSQMALSVNFAATNTRITMFYHTAEMDSAAAAQGSTRTPMTYQFSINSEAAHAMYYQHNYANSELSAFANNRNATIDGSQKLFLEPLGGTRIRLNMQPFVEQFRREHPTAVIHYAELLLPVHESADTSTPVRILALRNMADGTSSYVTDANVLTNSYTFSGFDGYYHRDKHQYRLRVTRHLQELLRTGIDYGTELFIDGRRSAAFRTVINGTESSSPIRVEFIYSE